MRSPFPRFVLAFGFLAVAAYAVYTLRGSKGISAMVEKEREIQQLEKENQALAQEIERKRDRIRRLSESATEQELEIRRHLKYVPPSETVFITGQPGKPAEKPPEDTPPKK